MKTKNVNGMGTITPRADGRFTVSLSAGRNANGKRLHPSTTCRTEAEAVAKLQEMRGAASAGLDFSRDGATVAELAKEWLDDCAARNLEAKTIRYYRQMVELYIVPSLGSVRVSRLDTKTLQQFFNKKGKTGLSACTVRHIRAASRNMLNLAVSWKMIGANPVTGTRPPKTEKKAATTMELDEARRLIAAVASERYGAFFAVMVGCGLRPGEGRGLRWKDVSLAADGRSGTITVNQQIQKVAGSYQITPPKTDAGTRTIPLAPFVVAALLRRREEQKAEREVAARYGIVFPKEWSHLVFTGEEGLPYSERYVVRKFHALQERIGNQPIRLYDLRHTCASILLSQNVPIKVVQEVMGHADAATTLNLYGHLMKNSKDVAASAMHEAFSGGA